MPYTLCFALTGPVVGDLTFASCCLARSSPCRVSCIQVFRTYNASVTLDRLLWSNEDGTPSDGIAADGTVDAKKASYDRANKEVRLSGIMSY